MSALATVNSIAQTYQVLQQSGVIDEINKEVPAIADDVLTIGKALVSILGKLKPHHVAQIDAVLATPAAPAVPAATATTVQQA